MTPPTATRRALLATGAVLAAGTSTAQALTFRDLLPTLRLGANLERWFPVAAAQRPRRLGPGWWQDLRAAGFDHARLFIPRDAGAGEEVPRLFLQAIEDAATAGLPIMLGLADLYEPWSPWDDAAWRVMQARARLFGAATDPARVALAPLNEPAFDNPAAWTPVRDRLLAAARAAAPRHALAWGGHEWCSWRSLLRQVPPADPLTIAEVHDYEGGATPWVAERFGAVAAWRDRHAVPVIVAELGGALPHAEDEAAWARDLSVALPVLRRLGLPATLWAVTHGGHWRIQQGETPRPRPLLAEALRPRR
jgi:hypothetical protein